MEAQVISEYKQLERRTHELRRTYDEVENSFKGGLTTEFERNAARDRFVTAKNKLKHLETAFIEAMKPVAPTEASLKASVEASRASITALRTEEETLAVQEKRLNAARTEAEQAMRKADAAFADQRRAALGRGAKETADPRPAVAARLRSVTDDLAAVVRGRNAITNELVATSKALKEAERSLAAMAEWEILQQVQATLDGLRGHLASLAALRHEHLVALPSTDRAATELGLTVASRDQPGAWFVQFTLRTPAKVQP